MTVDLVPEDAEIAPGDVTITEPGVYLDLSDTDYHRDCVPWGSLSQSGMKKLLPPSVPAVFRYEQLNGRPPKKAFDLGHAAHKEVLGTGPTIVVVDAIDWRTKKAKEQAAEAYAAGHVPILLEQKVQVEAMAAAIRAHPIASVLFDPEHGTAEVSGFWVDPETEVWKRLRLDWLPDPYEGGRVIIPDYKTTAVSANPATVGRIIANNGYHIQAPHYLDGAVALGMAGDDAAFVFVFQETRPPYLVSVVTLTAKDMEIGRDRCREATAIYADCVSNDNWPGYSDEVVQVSLPHWFTNPYTEDFS